MRSASRITLAFITVAGLLSGCAEKTPAYAPLDDGRPIGNLALGPTRQIAIDSEQFGPRALPPEAVIGYRIQSISGSTIVFYDDQSFYDRMGGGLFHSGTSYQEELWLR